MINHISTTTTIPITAILLAHNLDQEFAMSLLEFIGEVRVGLQAGFCFNYHLSRFCHQNIHAAYPDYMRATQLISICIASSGVYTP